MGRSQADRLLFVDVETTGLFSSDRVVSLGMISVDAAAVAAGEYEVKAAHYIFDPGKKSHPRAEEVHGYDDWTLRHQDDFAAHAADLRPLFDGSPLVVAHNVDFDRRFIEQEFSLAGTALPQLDYYCTMRAYREKVGGKATLNAVLNQMGMGRAGKTHGAFEDAWLAMQVYLWLNGHRYSGTKTPAVLPSNFREPPPRPDGPLPRRSKKKKAELMNSWDNVTPAVHLPPAITSIATLLLYLARSDGIVDSEIATLSAFLETDALALGYKPADRLDTIAAMMDLPTDQDAMEGAAHLVAEAEETRRLVIPWLRSIANADGAVSDEERQAIASITTAFRAALG